MSRIASNTYKVNSALEQIVEISNTSAIPVSEDADIVKWGGVATSLGSKLSASSVPVVIASDQGSVPISTTSTLNVDLDSVNGTSISLGQTTKSASIPVTLPTDGAITSGADTTLAAVQQVGIYGYNGGTWRQVDVSSTGVLKTEPELEEHAGTQGNLDNGSTVVSGDTSTSISTNNKTMISIFGSHSVASAELQVQVSADGTNFYPNGYSIFADANGDFYTLFEGCANNMRLKYLTSGTVTATLLANAH